MAGWEVKGLTLFCNQREYAGRWSGEQKLRSRGIRGSYLTSMNAGVCYRFPSPLFGYLLSLSTNTSTSTVTTTRGGTPRTAPQASLRTLAAPWRLWDSACRGQRNTAAPKS